MCNNDFFVLAEIPMKSSMAEGNWITVIYLFLRRSYSNISTNQKAYSDLSVICTFGSALKNK
jgi:hypothetical protein